MLDKQTFTKTLHSVMDIAKAGKGPMKREEVLNYFKEVGLTPEQEELIYQYFLKGQHGDFVTDAQMEEIQSTFGAMEMQEDTSLVVQELTQSERQQKEAEKVFLNAPFVKMYLKDIRSIKRLKQAELAPLYERLLSGDDEAADVVLHNYLHRVVNIAKKYVLLKVNMEDVVQEGNMGLLLAIRQLKGKGEQRNIKSYIESMIRQSMEDYINHIMEDDNWEQMVLGRARLLQEAKETLAKELLHVPSMSELSEYTHLTEEEILDIMSLVKYSEASYGE